MARLNLNNGSSATEEHHQTGHFPVPSEWKNNKCYRSSEQGKIFLFLDGQKKRGGGGGENAGPSSRQNG